MSNLLIPPFSIVDMNCDKHISLKVNESIFASSNIQSKSLDLYTYDDSEEIFNSNTENKFIENIIETNINSQKSSEDEQEKLNLDNQYLTERILQNILGINTQNKNKRKVGKLKEGYLQFYGINPINRYNFVIDRYNEETNKTHNITLSRVGIPKIFSRFFDLFIFLSRILLGIFLIITYYCSSYVYKQNSNNVNKARLIAYKKYLLNDNNFYTHSDKPSCIMVFICIVLILLSIFIIFSLYFVMLIPIVLFTLYLGIAVVICLYNKAKMDLKSTNIFENMIFESKLDDKCQLNDYIKINRMSLKYYRGFPYYEKIKEIYQRKAKNESIYIMLYGNLLIREYNIIYKSFINQIIGFSIYLVIGYFIYFK